MLSTIMKEYTGSWVCNGKKVVNPIALRNAKIANNFGLSECSRVIMLARISSQILACESVQYSK